MEMNTKNRDIVQNSKIMEKNITNIGEVQDRIEERMEKDFKQYCVDYNERKDQKINQTLA
jgi:hypothetical protein